MSEELARTEEKIETKLKCFKENFDNGKLNPKVRDEIMIDDELGEGYWEIKYFKAVKSKKMSMACTILAYSKYLNWRASLHEKMGVDGWTNEEIFEIEEKYYEFQYKKSRGILNPEVRDGQIKFDDNLREEEYWQMRYHETISKSDITSWFDIQNYVYYASGKKFGDEDTNDGELPDLE